MPKNYNQLKNKNIIISDNSKFHYFMEAFKKDGVNNLHVLADFDRTLTKAIINGKQVPSIISILRDGHYLSKNYAQKAHALFDKYFPIEIDVTLPKEEKREKMNEWWITHFDLLIKEGLNKKDLEKVVESPKLQLRKEGQEFFELLKQKNIPLVILSSAGLGYDSIEMYLKKHKVMSDNIHIISNVFEWDQKGKAIGVKKPIIHGMNKDETVLQNFPAFEKIKNRKNVLLLGDSLSDPGMVVGFNYNNLIKIGFLSHKSEESLEKYKEVYDIVILNDGSMNFINNLIREVI